MTPTETAANIAAILHETRSASWSTDRALELSAATINQPPEVLAMALVTYTHALLRASKAVLSMQVDCEKSQAARDAGELQ